MNSYDTDEDFDELERYIIDNGQLTMMMILLKM